MKMVDLTRLDDRGFVLHLDAEGHEVEARTFGKALVSLSVILRYIGRKVHPNQKIDIRVDSIGKGSFRARIKIVAKAASKYMFDETQGIIMESLSGYMFKKSIDNEESIDVTETEDKKVVISHQEEESQDKSGIVISREANDLIESIEDDPKFGKKVSNFVDGVDKDRMVRALGFTEDMNDIDAVLSFPKSRLPKIVKNSIPEKVAMSNIETKIENVELYKAVFGRAEEWEFIRNGDKISAMILDQHFLDMMEVRGISFSHGDIFEVRLIIHQVRESEMIEFRDVKYEIKKIHRKLDPVSKQTLIDFEYK